MRKMLSKKLLLNTFWLSLLLHLLLLASFSVVIISQPEEYRKPPNLYVPAYTYSGAITPSQQIKSNKSDLKEADESKPVEKKIPTAKNGILPKSMLLASYNMLQQEQQQTLTPVKNTEPIYLIGDTSEAADPLVRLLGKALSAHFRYPKVAGEFGMRGKTLVGMTLHPEGYFTDIQIIQSSNNDDLDAAALYAVNSAPRIIGANKYISKPKHFLVNFIFR